MTRPQPHISVSSPGRLVLAAATLISGHAWARQDSRPPEAGAPPATLAAAGQPVEEADDEYEGRLIRAIVVQEPVGTGPEREYRPLSPSVDALARNSIRAREGTPYSRRTVLDDVGRLTRLGRFSLIESRVQMLADGSVRVVYSLVPTRIVRDVQVVGNYEISNEDIKPEVDILVGAPIDAFQLTSASRRIEEMYRAKGYYLVQVTIDQKEMDETGVVLFKIREGERVRVTDIRFEGNRSFTGSQLESAIQTRRAHLFNRGPVDDGVLDRDVAAIVQFYRDRGHLDARADRLVRPSPDGKEAIVTFLVDEGPVYTLRSIEVYYPEKARFFDTEEQARAALRPGERLLVLGPGRQSVAVYGDGTYTREQLAGLMSVKRGDVVSASRVEESVDLIVLAYGRQGFADVQVTRREKRDPVRPEIDLLLMIEEGKAFRTGAVDVGGNEITRNNVILRELDIRPDRPLDTGAIEESERRLRQLGIFENRLSPPKITIQPPDPQDPEYRDVRVDVTETNTGSFSIGGAVGSDDGLRAFVTITESNFDLLNPPRSWNDLRHGAFRGGGQTFRIGFSPGTEVQDYSVSIADPALNDSAYSGTAAAYYRTREYNEYDEQRYGGRFGVGRRFGTTWSGSIPIRAENIELTDIAADAPVDYFNVAGPDALTTVGLQLARVDVDNRLNPSRGSRMSFGIDQAGLLGGDFDYTTLRADHALFLTLNETFLGSKTILSFKTAIGLSPQGQDAVPTYERFNLGGTSFRGFKFRTISPKGIDRSGNQTDDPVGGTFTFFFGAELKQPVWEDVLAVVFFMDSGTVREDFGFDQYRVSAGAGLRILVPQLSQVPLAFDFGFPLVKEDGDEERIFSFYIDIPFR